MDSITSEATQSPSSSQGRQTFKIFPQKAGNRGQGLHHRIGVKRQGECEYRSAWPRAQRDLLRVNEARLEALLAEQVQAKGQPAQEVKLREIKKEIDKQLERRAAAANRLMHAIDIADKKRLLTSRRARDAVELGDPDVILEVIIEHLQAIFGVETDGDKASFLAEGTQTLSIAQNEGLSEHFFAVRDRAATCDMFLGGLPGGDTAENRIFCDRFNEVLAIKLAVMSLDKETHVLRRRWEGTVPAVVLAQMSLEQYALGLTSFVLNETSESTSVPAAAPRAARVFSASRGAGDGAGAGLRVPPRCFRCNKVGHKKADCTNAAATEQEEPSLSDIKKLMVLLTASLTADAKPAVQKPAHASSVQAVLLSDEEGSDGDVDYA
jgi:hypothetical protein